MKKALPNFEIILSNLTNCTLIVGSVISLAPATTDAEIVHFFVSKEFLKLMYGIC